MVLQSHSLDVTKLGYMLDTRERPSYLRVLSNMTGTILRGIYYFDDHRE